MRKFGSPMKTAEMEKIVGEVRQSQIITTYGIGAIVDFVDDTVMIAGIDSWNWAENDSKNPFMIHNEGLQSLLEKEYFISPKVETNSHGAYGKRSLDIPAYRFPEKLYCVNCHRILDAKSLVMTRKRFRCHCTREQKDSIVPSRFVAVCPKGHIEDFPYSKWVHRGEECSKSKNPRIKLIDMYNRPNIQSLYVICEDCKEKRSMAAAFGKNGLSNIVKCSGRTPWLEEDENKPCGENLMTMMRTATGLYYPVTVSALSIPPFSEKVSKIVAPHFNEIDEAEGFREKMIEILIKRQHPNLTMQEILTAYEQIKKYRSNKKTIQDIYEEEYRVLTGQEVKTEEYYSERVAPPKNYSRLIKKITAVYKLTEIQVMTGFIRGVSRGEESEQPSLAPLSKKIKDWLPAIKLNGEGIFLEFDGEVLEKWKREKKDFYGNMLKRFQESYFINERVDEIYVFLHTFAHLFIRCLTSECGYSSASIKEKIYHTFQNGPDSLPMYGILIYTATSDADGSLGGLVEQAYGERVEQLIEQMMEDASWCSNDPVCINATKEFGQGVESLNYAACHCCALLPETSCEFHNVLLDRNAVLDLLEI